MRHRDLSVDQFHSVANWICAAGITLVDASTSGLTSKEIAQRLRVTSFEGEEATERCPAYRWRAYQLGNSSQLLSSVEREKIFFSYHRYTKAELKKDPSLLNDASALEKYSVFIQDYTYQMLDSYLAPGLANAAYWTGFCDTWTAVSLHYAEPKPVTVVNDDSIPVTFGSSDIKAI